MGQLYLLPAAAVGKENSPIIQNQCLGSTEKLNVVIPMGDCSPGVELERLYPCCCSFGEVVCAAEVMGRKGDRVGHQWMGAGAPESTCRRLPPALQGCSGVWVLVTPCCCSVGSGVVWMRQNLRKLGSTWC